MLDRPSCSPAAMPSVRNDAVVLGADVLGSSAGGGARRAYPGTGACGGTGGLLATVVRAAVASLLKLLSGLLCHAPRDTAVGLLRAECARSGGCSRAGVGDASIDVEIGNIVLHHVGLLTASAGVPHVCKRLVP